GGREPAAAVRIVGGELCAKLRELAGELRELRAAPLAVGQVQAHKRERVGREHVDAAERLAARVLEARAGGQLADDEEHARVVLERRAVAGLRREARDARAAAQLRGALLAETRDGTHADVLGVREKRRRELLAE